MNRRLFAVGSLAVLASACDSSSKSSSKKNGDAKGDDDKPKKQSNAKDGGNASAVPTGNRSDPLAGWVSAAVGDVSAKFPKAPETKSQEGKGVQISFLNAETSNDDLYGLVVAAYNMDLDETAVLSKAREGAFKSMKDKTLTQNDIVLNGMRGVETRATTPGPTQGVQRLYWDSKKRRTVTQSVVSNKKWDEQVAMAFLGSLTIK